MIFKEPTIYKSSLDENDILNFVQDIKFYKPIVLNKYSSYMEYMNENKLKINNAGVYQLFGAFYCNHNFTPYYSNSDIYGDSDWPLLFYFDVDEGVIKQSSNTYSFMNDALFSEILPLQINLEKDKNKIFVRANRNMQINASRWYNFYGTFI